MREEVFMAGTGGQGVLLIGHVLAQAALEEGLQVSWFPIYSPEVRGGSSTCTVVVSDAAVAALARAGFSVKYGARFLKRAIDEKVKVPVTLKWKESDHFLVEEVDGEVVLITQKVGV